MVKKIIERKQKQMEKIYPGMKCFKDGVRQIPIESIPGLQEMGWKPTLEEKYVIYNITGFLFSTDVF